MSRWQGCWLVVMWLLLPGWAWGQQPLLTPRASGGADRTRVDEPLKLVRPASNAASRSTNTAEASRGKTTSWTTTTASLLFVLTLIAGGAYLLRRQGRRIPGLLPEEIVQVLGRRYVDQRNSLQLIRCGSKILVLASSTQSGLSTLSEITDPLEVELITRQCLGNSADRLIPGPHAGAMPRSPNAPLVAGGSRG